jgi:hypothetical protein
MDLESLLGGPIPVFFGLTVILVGGAAWLTGRAIALGWRPVGQVLLACLGLAFAARFLTFALFGGPLFSVSGFLTAYFVLAAMGLVAYRVTLVARMVRQYPWRYRRVSLFAYREIESEVGPTD